MRTAYLQAPGTGLRIRGGEVAARSGEEGTTESERVRRLAHPESRRHADGMRVGKLARRLLKVGPVGVALLLGAAALGQPVAAQTPGPETPVPLAELHLDQSGATWTESPGVSRTVSVALTAGPSGALLVITLPNGYTQSLSVVQAGADQLQLVSSAAQASGNGSFDTDWDLTGSGSHFAGTHTNITPNGTTFPGIADTLTLAGTGLTLVTSATPTPGGPSSSVALPTPDPSAPAWFLEGCYKEQSGTIQDTIQNFQSSATDLLSAGQATVTLDVGQPGTLSGVLAFDGSGGNGSAIAFRPDTPRITLLDGPGATGYPAGSAPAFSCSDPCVVAFEGGGGNGSAIGFYPGDSPGTPRLDAASGCGFDFDGGTGSGSAVAFLPGGAPNSTLDVTRQPAARLTAASPTPVPVGTQVAGGEAAYMTTGSHTLALPLTAAGRSLLEQVKAADAAYWAASPQGQSPPYALMTLTLSFTPAASAAGGVPIVVWVVPLVVIFVVVVIVLVLWRRRRLQAATV